MESFWSTISAYNAATWPIQIALTIVAICLTIWLYRGPSTNAQRAIKIYMALLNFWIAAIYFAFFGQEREYHIIQTLLWAIMGCIWVYDLVMYHPTMSRREGRNRFAVVILAMPLAYPLLSLALGREFPAMTTPIMPCSVALFSVGLMLAFSQRLNLVLAMLLCHWALIGLSKVYTYGITEDFLLSACAIPALYIFFNQYISTIRSQQTKPSPRVLKALLMILCTIIATFFTITLLQQLGVVGIDQFN